MDEAAFSALKTKLDEVHVWPCVYIFKFIVKKEQTGEIEALFREGTPFERRDSKAGKYVGMTAQVLMETSQAVISVYREALKINGCIAL
jgi:hypothetical protein